MYNIGNVFLDHKRYYDAEHYFSKALELENKDKNTLRKARLYLSLGIIKCKTDDDLESLEFATHALSKFTTAGETEGKAKSNLLLGDIYLKKGSFDSAMLYYNTSKDLLDGTHFERIKLEWNLSYAQYLIKVDSIPKARIKLQSCLGQSAERELLLLRLEALIRLYELEKKINNFQTSLNYLEEYQHLDDSLQSLNLQNKIDLLTSKLNIESSSQELIKSKPSTKNTYHWPMLISILSIIILGFYLTYRFYFKKVLDEQG